MLHQQFGTRLIGFSKKNVCPQCNNETPYYVYQDYVKNRAFFIPVGTQFSSIFLSCPVCEKKEYIVNWTPVFSSNDTKAELLQILNDGREYTKYWFQKLNANQQEEVLKRLNSIKAYDLVRFLGLS